MFQTFILPAISYGLSATSIPGPMQAYLLNTTLTYGWRRGLLVILAPLIVDGPVILLSVFILQQIPDWALQAIRIGGGLLLLWIAYGAWQQLRAGATFRSEDETVTPEDASPRKILMQAVAMNALSPGPYLFWSTVTGPLLKQALDDSTLAAIGMLLAFYGTFLGGMALLVLMVNQLGQIGADFTRYLLLVTIALLIWFGTGLIMADAFGLMTLHRVVALLAIGVLLVYFFRPTTQQNNRQIIL